MTRLANAYDRFLDSLGFLAGGLIVFAALGITADVFGRNVPGLGPIPWMLEVVEYALFIATFAGAPWVLRRGAHVAVDVIVRTLPHSGQRVAENFANFLGLIVSVVLLYYAYVVTANSARDGSLVIKELIFPEWWLFAFVAASIFLIVVEFAIRLSCSVRGIPRSGTSGPSF